MNRLESFLNSYTSANTVKAYRIRLNEYFSFIYPESFSIEEKINRYFTDSRNYEEDIRAFFTHIKNKPPTTVNLSLVAVKNFLIENGVEPSTLFWRRLRGRRRGTRPLTLDKVPSNAQLRQILTHMPVHGKALYLLLSSSGMRIGEALKLTLHDMDLEQDPPLISVHGAYTKNGNSRRTYMSQEAREAVQEWLKVREQYLKAAVGKAQPRPQYKKEFKGKSADDPRLFPFEWSTAAAVWRNALAKSGFEERDNGTNRRTLHPHVLRKFFRTKLGGVIPIDVVEALMGHEGYLTEAYRRYTEEDLARFYKQGEHALLVFSNGAEISKLKEDIQQEKTHLQAFVDEFSKKVALENQELRSENSELKSKLAKVDLELTEFKKSLAKELAELRNQIEDTAKSS